MAAESFHLASAPSLPYTLRGFRDLHAGETLLVCGCGRSLLTLADPTRFVTIGVNDVGRLFQPDYLVVLNARAQFTRGRFRYVEESTARAVFTQLDLRLAHPHVVRFTIGRRGGTDLDDPDRLPHTRNSPYVAIALALHMGAQRIGVIGVDYTDHHFFADDGRHPLAAALPQIDDEYRRLYETWRQRGVEIYNLSAISRVTAFPQLSFDELAALPAPGPRLPAPARPVQLPAPSPVRAPAPRPAVARAPSALPRHRRDSASRPSFPMRPSPGAPPSAAASEERDRARPVALPSAAVAPPPLAPPRSPVALPPLAPASCGDAPSLVRSTSGERATAPASALDLTLVIAADGAAERQAAVWLVSRLAGLCDFVLATCGLAPQLLKLAECRGGRYVWQARRDARARGAAMNLGAAQVRTGMLLWLDAGVLVDAAFVSAAVEEMEERALDSLVAWSSLRELDAADFVAVMEGKAEPADRPPVAETFSRYGTVATPLLVRTELVRRCGGVYEAAHECAAQAWFIQAARCGRAAVTRRGDQPAYCLAGRAPAPDAAALAVVREMRAVASPDELLRRFPGSASFAPER